MKRKKEVPEVVLNMSGGEVLQHPTMQVSAGFATQKRRGRGRPKGSKNKATLAREAIQRMTAIPVSRTVSNVADVPFHEDFQQVSDRIALLSKQYEQRFLTALGDDKENKFTVLTLHRIQHGLMEIVNRIKTIEAEAAVLK